MAEVIVQFTELVRMESGRAWIARVCGEEQSGGTWHGWLEFIENGGGSVLRTDRETTQPNRDDLEYWASGLSSEYLESALERAATPREPRLRSEILPPQAPAPTASPPVASKGARAPAAVLDPFAVYAQGENVLSRELGALSADHLRSIVRVYGLNDGRALSTATHAELMRLILAAVRGRERTAGGDETRAV
jgi:hypothetical protein